jgi:intracellular sulfur oxidation DsrE/DsrF family protein
MKQLKNVFTLAPGAKLEVICHGPGISMLVKAKSVVQENIAQIKMKGVEFVACEFTMKDRNITKDEIVP